MKIELDRLRRATRCLRCCVRRSSKAWYEKFGPITDYCNKWHHAALVKNGICMECESGRLRVVATTCWPSCGNMIEVLPVYKCDTCMVKVRCTKRIVMLG